MECFFNAFYRFSFCRGVITPTHPLFDDLQNVNVLITTFTDRWAFQLIFLYNFSVVYSTERNLFKIHGILIPSNGLP
jgi:hypothetical protein